jgi:rubrerythrin
MTKEIQKAIDFIHAYMHPVDDSESEKRKLKYRDMAIRSLEAWEKVKEEIKKLPPVNPQPKTGYWTRELIRNEKGGCIGAKMICSECGNDNKHDEYMHYCPNCGAKMVEPQAEKE